jgi:hypothetical protein
MVAAMSRLSLFVILIAACAGPSKPGPQTAGSGSGSGSGSGVVCHEVTDTGSLMSHTECTPIDDSQEQTKDAQRFLQQPRSEPTSGK